MNAKRMLGSAVAALALLTALPALAQEVPAGYPADYAQTVAKAKQEGKVVVYSPTDAAQANAVIGAFQKKYPGVTVDFNDLSNTAAYNRAISEFAAGQVGSDIMWTVGLDLQVKLVEDGLAEPYTSPEAAHIPDFAKYKDTAYLTSIEPGVILYNKSLLPTDMVPTSLSDLAAKMKANPKVFDGKVATWDPEKSGQGYVAMQDDAHRDAKAFWDLVGAFGAVHGKTYPNSGQMREKVLSGEQIVAFYVNGAYAAEWVKGNPTLGIVYASDRTGAVSRAAQVSKNAPHPDAAKLFLDFMLSQEGQQVMADAGLPSVRSDVTPGFDTLNTQAHGHLQPIALDAKLLDNLDTKKRADFFAQWKKLVH